jgi:drug/metabolite transporter (DMT)-like permease
VKLWAALWTVYLVWGSTYLAIKVAVDTLPPVLSAGARFLAAGALLLAILAALGRGVRVTGRELAGSALLGAALLTFGVGIVHLAETRIDSSVAAMIAGSVPLQVILWRRASGERVPVLAQATVAVGLMGLALIVLPGAGAGGTAVGLALMLGATMSWSAGSFFSRRLTVPADPLLATAVEMLCGGFLLLPLGLALGEASDLGGVSLESFAAWAYLVVFGSLVAFTAYAWLLRHAPISTVVTHQYVNPVVAIALGAALLGEDLSWTTAGGAILVIGSVFVAVRKPA